MKPRVEAIESAFARTLCTLGWVFVFALACGFPIAGIGIEQSAYAQQEQEADDTAAPADDEKSQPEEADDEPQEDPPAEKPAEKTETKEEESAPAEAAEKEQAAEKEEPTEKEEAQPDGPAEGDENQKSTEKKTEKKDSQKDDDAEESTSVSEAQKVADEEEEAKSDEAEAAGAEVEVDESDEVEEEPEDSEEAPDKPVVKEDKPVKPTPSKQKRVIGATATIMEKQSELLFRARVDSGAKSCSLHIEEFKIENESDTMAENIGKVIRFNIVNGDGESHWLEAKIAGYVIVKTAAHRERRYKVPLTFRYKDFEKTVLVTLNNREKMEFPLLLGRNFLLGDFVVDVEVDNTELHTR